MLSPEQIRTLAHPMRSRMHVRLRTGGPATATALARELDTNSGATSYHLRRLADAGLVADTGEGAGRRRLWAATSAHTTWTPADLVGDEDAETALAWLSRDYLRHFDRHFERWLDAESAWPAPWRQTLGMTDVAILATAEQAAAMRAEIDAVLHRYRRVGQGNPSARRVAVYVSTYPIDLDRPPRGVGE